MDAHMEKTGLKEVLVGLDIGTSKVLAVSGRLNDKGQTEIIGYGAGYYDSVGLNKGVVVNVEDTAKAIRKAVSNMEMMAPCGDIKAVYTGLTGEHIRGYNACGIVAIKGSEVADQDISSALNPAQVVLPGDSGKRILHIIPQSYIVDEYSSIKEPRGMLGNRLEAKVHVVACDENITRNLERCVNSAELDVLGIALNQIAVGDAVLTDEEKELGACLVDIGAGTIDIAIFTEGTIQHTAMIPLGGCEVTNDLSLVFKISRAQAEDIKLKYGCASPQMVPADEALPPLEVGGGAKPLEIQRQLVAQIIEARYRELFTLIADLLERSGFGERIVAGLILTGGAACMPGLKELAEESFCHHVCIGRVTNAVGIPRVLEDPAFTSAVGILMQGMDGYMLKGAQKTTPVLHKLQSWINKYF